MEQLLEILEKNKYKYYSKGIYKDGFFYEFPNHFKLNALKVQIKKDYEDTFLKMFDSLVLNEMIRSKYEIVYKTTDNIYLFIEFVVDSHILIPKVLLKDFKSDDSRIYYIDTIDNKIKYSSVRKYNTKFGYYSLRFEEYLSINFENKIGKIKKKIEDFIFKNEEKIQFIGLFNDISDFLNMSFFRNPNFVKEVNNESLSSKIRYKGYNSEEIAKFYEQFQIETLDDMNIFILVNRTQQGLVLSGEIFSNVCAKGGIDGLILPLHPKYAIIIVPNKYYNKQKQKYSSNCYSIIDDLETLNLINKRIYLDCKKLGTTIVGKKEDIERIINLYGSNVK